MRILQALRLRSPGRRAATALGALALLVAFVGAGAAAADTTGYSDSSEYPQTAGYEGSYSYVRTLEGSATLIQGDTGDRDALQVNQPVLVGDRILVAPRGRVEVVLSDRNLLRIDAGSEVAFEALAASPDRQDRLSVLGLSHGNLQLVVVQDFLGEGLPRVDTRNVTVYPRDAGSYRVTADGSDWSEVVARDGSAEVVTREGSLLIRRGEEAVVDGDDRPRRWVRQASREDSLELWGRRLDQEARYAAAPYVDESLQYEAAALDRHGSWVTYEGRYAWRPRVAVEWRPYHHGRWAFSPLGLTWVSYEPWGWVPYHYGTWDYVPTYGWVWYPGRRFAPAWVYWYWTDSYVAWVPYGHLGFRYYDIHGGLHRYGVYGWAGGHWSHYHRWTFCETRFLGHRDQHRFARDADRFARETRLAVPRKGLITTDTRGLTRTAVERRAGIVDALAERRTDASRELPDVTSFVAGRRDLSDDVRSRILVERSPDGTRSAERVLPALDGGEGRGRSVTSIRPDVSRDGERSAPGAAERRAPVLSPRPAERPEAVRPSGRTSESWRRPAADTVRSAPRAPEASRSPADTPRRIEPRPATPPSRSIEPAPSSGRQAPESWRSRPPVRPPERSPAVGDRGSDRSGASDRYSIPRRVIDGVRSNTPGSTPFRTVEPSDRSERVQPRPERVEPRRIEPPRSERRYEPRSAPPPRVEPRSQRSVEPRRVEPAPRSAPPPRASSSRSSSSGSRSSAVSSRSSSRSSSPSARSSSRSSSSRSSSARSSSSRSSSRSSSGRSARSRSEPPVR